MPKDGISKMKYADAKALYYDESAPKEDREAAKNRMDSIREWLNNKGGDSGSQKKSYTPKADRRPIQESDFSILSQTAKDKIAKDTTTKLAEELCRLYHIETNLKALGIDAPGVFTGMLLNNQYSK